MKTLSRNDIRNLCILICLFLLLMLFCSCYTSPVYPNLLGWDSAIFSLMGKGILEGKVLYTDLFDHKGPVIFLINALGNLLGGRSGIFLLQCVSGSLTMCFLYLTGKMLRPKGTYRSIPECLALFSLGMALFFYTFEGGNLTEEYSLPFISLCCYLFVRYLIRSDAQPVHPPRYAFVYGICLAVLAFLRLNNAVTICAGILYIALYLCARKQYRNLFMNLLCGLLGLAAISVPILLVCLWNNSLEEMLHATFLHNFVIVGNTAREPFLSNWKQFTVLYLPFFCLRRIIPFRMAQAEEAARFGRSAAMYSVFQFPLSLACQPFSPLLYDPCACLHAVSAALPPDQPETGCAVILPRSPLCRSQCILHPWRHNLQFGFGLCRR